MARGWQDLDFSLQEFERVSARPLTVQEKENALVFADTILQPVRDIFGPVCITSYVRVWPNIGAGPHGNGEGVDFAPCDGNMQKMAMMHAFLGLFLKQRYGKALLEEDHIHLTLPGVQGVTGDTLVMQRHSDGTPTFRKGIIWGALALPILVLIAFTVFLRGNVL